MLSKFGAKTETKMAQKPILTLKYASSHIQILDWKIYSSLYFIKPTAIKAKSGRNLLIIDNKTLLIKTKQQIHASILAILTIYRLN